FQYSINIISRHFLNHKFSHEQNPRCYGYWIVDLDVGVAVNLGVVLCPSVVVSLDVSALSSHSLDIFFHPIVAASFDAAVFHPNVAASFDPALVSPSILFPPLYGANSLAQFHEPTFQGHHEQA